MNWYSLKNYICLAQTVAQISVTDGTVVCLSITAIFIRIQTLRDKIRSDQLRQLSGIQDIIKWTNVRRKEWDAHVE